MVKKKFEVDKFSEDGCKFKNFREKPRNAASLFAKRRKDVLWFKCLRRDVRSALYRGDFCRCGDLSMYIFLSPYVTKFEFVLSPEQLVLSSTEYKNGYHSLFNLYFHGTIYSLWLLRFTVTIGI